LILEFLVIAGSLAMGARMGGVGLGLWGAMGLLVLVVCFDVAPAKIPGEVLLIVLTVIMAASATEVAGGIDFLVRIAERIIRKNPKQITVIAPLVTYGFTFAAGTGHIVYPPLPVIYEVAHENGIRPERPMAIATIASQQAITASPVSAATAAMIGLLAPHGIGLVQILIICVPSTLIAVFVASLVQLRIGKELKDDPEYQKRLASGEVELHRGADLETSVPLKAGARASALIFLWGCRACRAGRYFPRTADRPRRAEAGHSLDADCYRNCHARCRRSDFDGNQSAGCRSTQVRDLSVGNNRYHWHPWAGLAVRHLH
jgi:anaerobic C4-dicarboxylate transporter DcuA